MKARADRCSTTPLGHRSEGNQPPPVSMPSGPRYTPSRYGPRAPLLPARIRRWASSRFARRSRRFARRPAIEDRGFLKSPIIDSSRFEPRPGWSDYLSPSRLGDALRGSIGGSLWLAAAIAGGTTAVAGCFGRAVIMTAVATR